MRLVKMGEGGGWSTVEARSRVNPDDPLRARATLLLGSGCSAHFYNRSDFTRFRCSARLYASARQPRGATDSLCQLLARRYTALSEWIRSSGASPVMSGGILPLNRHE